MKTKQNRNFSIDLYRIAFTILIVSNHFYSYYLSNYGFSKPVATLFKHCYIGDEVFFMISGIYFAKWMLSCSSENIGHYLIRRIRTIAFPYYVSWIVTFIIQHIMNGVLINETLKDLSTSVYELLFLTVGGFGNGYITSSVSWFFSALLLSLMITYLIAQICSSQKYVAYMSGILAIALYGFLNLNFERLVTPFTPVLGNTVYKGLIRGLAGVNAGISIYSLSIQEQVISFFAKHRKCITSIRVMAIFALFGYCLTIFDVTYDYVFVIVIFILLLICTIQPISSNSRLSQLVNFLSKLTKYVYCSSIILYATGKWIYVLSIPWPIKYLLFIGSALLIAFIEQTMEKLLSKYLIMRKR